MQVKVINKIFIRKRIYKFENVEIPVMLSRKVININNSYIVCMENKNNSYIQNSNEKMCENIKLNDYMEKIEYTSKEFIIREDFLLDDIKNELNDIMFFDIKTTYGIVKFKPSPSYVTLRRGAFYFRRSLLL